MSTTTCQNLSRNRIKSQLESYINQLQPGEPLPTFRSLMKTYRVSQSRLQAVLDEMSDAGVIHRQPRKGIFRSDKSLSHSSGVGVVDLVACGQLQEFPDPENNPFFTELVSAFSEAVSQSGRSIRLHKFEPQELYARCIELSQRPGVSAVVLMTLQGPEVAHVFKEARIPVVALFPRYCPDSYVCPTITAEPKIIDMQLRHLWDLGHERISMLHRFNPEMPNWVFREWRERFYRLMAERGLKVRPEWVQKADGKDKSIFNVMDIIFEKSPNPTAIIVADGNLSAVYRYLERKGLGIGKDISVMGTDDLQVARTLHPLATTVRNSRVKAVEISLKLLERLILCESVEKINHVPAELVVRESTAIVARVCC